MGKGSAMAWSSVVLVLALVGAASALVLPGCNNTRPAVLECIQQLLDLDHNGIITPVDVAVALATRFTFVPEWLTWQLIMRCDMNEDGVLTIADWNANPSNITCLPTQNCVNIACSVCVQNGFVQQQVRTPDVHAQPASVQHKVHRVIHKPKPEQVKAVEHEVLQEMERRKQ